MLRYESGSAHAVVRGGAVVVLPEPGSAELVATLWEQLEESPGVVEVLQTLTGAFGSSLRTLPPFVVAVVSGQRVHVAVRGPLTVSLEQADGSVLELDGDHVTTWSERIVDDVVELVLGAGDPSGAAALLTGPVRGDAKALPLGSGVVLTGAVTWTLVERPAPEREPEPAADVAPAEVSSPQDAATGFQAMTLLPTDETFAPEPDPAPAASGGPVDAHLSTDAQARGLEASEPEALEPVEEPGEPVTPEPAPGDDYAHLWGSTVLRTVEDAAVRAEEGDEHEEPAATPPVPPVPAPPTLADPVGPADPDQPAPSPDTSFPEPDGGMIAGVPREWTGATPAAAHRASIVDPDASPVAGSGAEVEAADGVDHDGHTVLSSAIADLRRAAQDAPGPEPVAAEPPAFVTPAPEGQEEILARPCPQGHANPPSRDECKICGAALSGDARLTVRPSLGRVEVSTGQSVELDRTVVVGRRPRTPRTQAAQMPRLVTVPSPQQDISRSHVEVTLEGWHVLIADMATTNGTTLLRHGQPPLRLHPSEPVLVVDGDVVDLGDGVTLVFEGIW